MKCARATTGRAGFAFFVTFLTCFFGAAFLCTTFFLCTAFFFTTVLTAGFVSTCSSPAASRRA